MGRGHLPTRRQIPHRCHRLRAQVPRKRMRWRRIRCRFWGFGAVFLWLRGVWQRVRLGLLGWLACGVWEALERVRMGWKDWDICTGGYIGMVGVKGGSIVQVLGSGNAIARVIDGQGPGEVVVPSLVACCRTRFMGPKWHHEISFRFIFGLGHGDLPEAVVRIVHFSGSQQKQKVGCECFVIQFLTTYYTRLFLYPKSQNAAA